MLVSVLRRSYCTNYLLVPLHVYPVVSLELVLILGLILVFSRQSFTLGLCNYAKNSAAMVPMKLNLAQVRDDLPSLTGCNLATGRSILGVSTRRLDILL